MRRPSLFVNRGGTDDPDGYRLPVTRWLMVSSRSCFVVRLSLAHRYEASPSLCWVLQPLRRYAKRTKNVYNEIKELYDRFGESAPIAPWEEPENKNNEVTNFPCAR